MKRIAISIAAGLSPYMVAAFSAWDFNVSNYAPDGRFAIASFGIGLALATYAWIEE